YVLAKKGSGKGFQRRRKKRKLGVEVTKLTTGRLVNVSPSNESMLQIKILLDVVGRSGYRCRVLQSFLVERIEQGIG
ncbi:hypothetical protein Tco_1544704, partial [Tanacetum coccineum]